MNLCRRTFLFRAGLGLAAFAGVGLRRGEQTPLAKGVSLIDCHAHLFGVGDGDSGCFLHEKQRRHWTFRYLTRLLRIQEPKAKGDPTLDEQLVQRLVQHARGSSLDRIVLQAWDGRYTGGKLDRGRTSSLYVPNDYLFKVVGQYPDLFIPCASINPKRADALEELDRCAGRGARMVKLHPPTMNVDPGDPSFRPFYRSCRKRNVIVMVHTGTEHAADVVGFEGCNPAKLTLALREGCTVVAAHAGFGEYFDRDDFYPSFARLVREYPNLYGDTSILAAMLRWRCLPRLMEDKLVMSRMIHGSDYPFASNALVFWNRLSLGSLVSLAAQKNLFERDLQLKRHLGLAAGTFTLGAKLLGLN